MSSSMNLSPESAETSRYMGHASGHVRCSRHPQPSADGKQILVFPRSEKCSVSQDKPKVGHPIGQPHLVPNCEERQNVSIKQMAQHSEDDELVKHMSNLPGFLQQMEKETSIQETALNFGVLDWKRLEKWKYNERMPSKYPKKTSSTSNSFSPASGPPKRVPDSRKPTPSHVPHPSSLYSGKMPIPHISRFSSPNRQPPPSCSSHLNSAKEERNTTHHKEEKYIERTKSNRKEACSQEVRFAKSSTIDNFHKNNSSPVANVDNSNMKDPIKEIMSGKGALPSERGKHKFTPSPDKKANAQGRKSAARLKSEVNFTSDPRPADLQNIVLLKPKYFQNNCTERSQFTECRTLLDGQLAEAIGKRLSNFVSPQELYSGELSANIPHSCPLPSGAIVDIEPATMPHNKAKDLDTSRSECPDPDSVTSVTSEGKCSTMHGKTATPSSSEATAKGGPPSPTRRFSFSLGRMNRSSSFKESSVVPQLSSTYTTVKSGPLMPEVSSGVENCERNQANASSKGRSSPLRRLLDPLLKHKGAQSAETMRPPNRILNSMNVRTMGTNTSSHDKGSRLQALLQLSLKNGLPLFKLVVDNSNDMLMAVVKRLPETGKIDPCMTYVFYSVHEIRKKSTNWINQGSKSKNCSLGYNVVGQMKISSSLCNADARECVLYGTDPAQVDKKTTSEYLPYKEIVAIVVRNSREKLNDGEKNDEGELYKEMEFSQEKKIPNGTVVILPGGVHGIPIKGAPSSLISRWKSGGSCDCGGWDIGCKLRILCSHGASSAIDLVNLFVQGKEQKGKPVFSLEPFSNGFYSIELDASISLLEAFATSVAYVTCRKFPEIIDTKARQEYFPETILETHKVKTASTFQRARASKIHHMPAFVTSWKDLEAKGQRLDVCF